MLTNIATCAFAKVICTRGCGKLILRKNLIWHFISECSKRKIKCKYCGKMDHYEVISGKHMTVCEEYPVKCPRGCTQSSEIKRKDLKKHAEVCPLEEVQCPFSEAGCDASILRKDLSAHIEMSGQQHLMKMMTAYTVFIRIVAAATINFGLAGVRLLIEGGSYSRAAFIYLEGYLAPCLRRSGGILL